eukprot:2311624-Pyramimonas_sp.AAC.1
MMHDLTLPLHDWGVRKDSSRLYMTCGEIARTDGYGHIRASVDLLIPACSGFRSFSMRRVCRIKVLGDEVFSTYLLPAHPDVEYRIKEARACFIGQADFSFVTEPLLHTSTADASFSHMLNASEGWCLCRMFRRQRREGETMADWNRRRYHEARKQFRSYGSATLVQRFLRTVWNSAKSAAHFIYILRADVQDDLSSTQRTWRDHHMITVAYDPLWDRLRTDASEFLRGTFRVQEASQLKRRHNSCGKAVGQRCW